MFKTIEWEATDPERPHAPAGYVVDFERSKLVAKGRYRAPLVVIPPVRVVCPAANVGTARSACDASHVAAGTACAPCVRAFLRARPAAIRCCRGCPGWAVFETNHIPTLEVCACDDCNSGAKQAGLPVIRDDDAANLPEARRALAVALVPAGRRSRSVLRVMRAAALREHDLLTALYTVHLWADPNTHTERCSTALVRIRETTREALDLADD